MKQNIERKIDESFVKKTIGPRENMEAYLTEFYKEKRIEKELPKTIKKIIEEIINTWDYAVSKNVIRELFKTTQKYNISKYSDIHLNEMIGEWMALELGPIEWPFAAAGFDTYMQTVNHSHFSDEEKDIKVMKDAVRFRRIKEINTSRNDYIEYLIFEHNENIMPTLKHNREVDFYIDGVPYDQKVSRSVGKKFKEDYGENYKEYAIKHPEIVAKYLYQGQDEDRFGYQPRLLVVYLDDDVKPEKIADIIIKTNFKNPIQLEFDYNHAKVGVKNYKTECFVVLLYN